MTGCLLCHPLQAKGCQIVAQSHWMPKLVQSVQIGTHPRTFKVQPISNFNCHIHGQHPKISKDLLL
jgi:hypothetical protein